MEYQQYEGAPRRRKFKILPIVIFAVFALGYYFTHQEVVPITGRKQFVDMSIDQEMNLGLQSYQEVLSTSEVVRSGPELDLIRSVGARIAKAANNPDFQWEFNLLRSQEINAFCLPGGKVAVYTGIMPITQNADGLAVVMGHEIAHAIARHGAERMAQGKLAQLGQMAVGMAVQDMDEASRRGILGAFGIGAQYGIMLPFSRDHESEADHIGLILMARACFNPEEAPIFWQRMEEASSQSKRPPEFMSTHPNPDTRISQLNAWMEEAKREREANCGTM